MRLAGGPTLAPLTRRRVMLPFMIVTLIWGSTWLVIRSQLGEVPSVWSVSYRFAIAAAAMAVYALASGHALRIGGRAIAVAVTLGLAQFCLNFQLVYLAEAHVTSGVVAMLFALLLVPNAILGRLFLGQQLSRPFLIGSAVALAGIVILGVREIDVAGHDATETAVGIGLTLLGVLAASVGNVVQATVPARTLPLPALLTWGMVFGALFDALAALATAGPPVLDARPVYWLGLAYLSLAASTLAFPLYFGVIRQIGAARAAYSNVIVPVIAMTLSTLFEGYRWTAANAAGAALVFAGLVFALRSRNPAR